MIIGYARTCTANQHRAAAQARDLTAALAPASTRNSSNTGPFNTASNARMARVKCRKEVRAEEAERKQAVIFWCNPARFAYVPGSLLPAKSSCRARAIN
jgi:hypothetical protein